MLPVPGWRPAQTAERVGSSQAVYGQSGGARRHPHAMSRPGLPTGRPIARWGAPGGQMPAPPAAKWLRRHQSGGCVATGYAAASPPVRRPQRQQLHGRVASSQAAVRGPLSTATGAGSRHGCSNRFGGAHPPRIEFLGTVRPRKRAPRADVAQLVEHHLAKVRVAGSNPVVRSEALPWRAACPRWSGREARQRPAKPCTWVQIPSPPPRSLADRGRLAQW